MKDTGAEPNRRSDSQPASALEGAKKSSEGATLDLRSADFESLAPTQRGSSLASQAAPKTNLVPLRSRMVAWARRIAARLSELGIEVEATWSDEEPIVRQGEAGAEQPPKTATASILFHAPVRKNAILALRLQAHVVEVSIEIYPSVHARAVSEEIARLFDALPDQFSLGGIEKIQDETRIPTREASANDVRALLEGEGSPRAAADPRPGGLARAAADFRRRGLWLGWSVPRDLVLKHAALVGEQLGDAVMALAPVFALVTETAVRPDSFASGASLGALARASGAAAARGRSRPSLPASSARTRGRPLAPLEKGSVVRVLSGPFVGKTGVVQELDGRGAAKVMLGLLATRVDVGDLALSKDGPNRPILSSSHRRPLGAR
ncbi:transcription termination/antitermination protein NusG [Pendulispora albinea]|uniref:KOW motif-containing protein n=1 Tax=Pendulispora albinea TaxID=2741071 RepID=A0ABZ2LNN3_9BACT